MSSELSASCVLEPAYLQLTEAELQRRAKLALARLAECTLCPRQCRADRLHESGNPVCRTGRHARVSSYFAHFGEENCLSGTRGSGTIFFSWCNLRCAFCQNFELSALGEGTLTEADELAGMMLSLQRRSCHNINLVTPSHVVAHILEGLAIAVPRGLRIPLVFNTSSYDLPETLALLDGIVDIYMPDFKFWDESMAKRYAGAPDYPAVARAAIKTMHAQVGDLVVDDNGIARRGVLLRHLVMPGASDSTAAILHWIAEELSPNTYVNLMAQYHPAGHVNSEHFPEINRRISSEEYRSAWRAAQAAGLTRVEVQGMRLLNFV